MYHPIRVTNLTGEATVKQIEYAEAIHNLLGIELPAEKTKQAYSDYISEHYSKYKRAMRDLP